MNDIANTTISAVNFEQIIDRRETNALAYEGYEGYLFAGEKLTLKHRKEDLIHMWVADMALATPQAAINGMLGRIKHPILGYSCHFDNAFYDVFHAWTIKHYGWSFRREELLISSGIIPALYTLVKMICAADEKVLTFTPSYGYFKHAADFNQSELVTSALIEKDGKYAIDFDDFLSKASDSKTKLLFLCHPHNPTGRIWSKEELRKIGVIIVSDEIHCDLLRHGRTHVPMAKLFSESNGIITCMAPSKTFNLAGMSIASVIIPDADLRDLWAQNNLPFLNPISLAAARGAYQDGEAWLKELRSHLDNNFAELKTLLEQHLPLARFEVPDATYLAWIDVSAYFPRPTNLTRFFAENAGVILEGGDMFVADAENRIRLNIACPKSVLQESILRIAGAIKSGL